MTSTPKSIEDVLGESWVEVTGQSTPERITPLPFATGEEYLRLLKEAQRESNQSSARVSLASSRRDSPHSSPKSPPNSPNTELAADDDLKGVYINYSSKEGDFVRVDRNTDWIWDWSSRPDQMPPKDWKFKHPKRKTYSIRTAKVGKVSLFSKEVLYTLFLTNMLSLILGTGIGVGNALRKLYSPVLTMQFFLQLLILCTNAFVVASAKLDAVQLTFCGAYVVGNILQLFVLSHLGEMITSESRRLMDDAYGKAWYACHPSLRSYLKIIFLQCQKPFKMSALGVFPLSIETFKNVVGTAYSYFMVLENMKKSD